MDKALQWPYSGTLSTLYHTPSKQPTSRFIRWFLNTVPFGTSPPVNHFNDCQIKTWHCHGYLLEQKRRQSIRLGRKFYHDCHQKWFSSRQSFLSLFHIQRFASLFSKENTLIFLTNEWMEYLNHWNQWIPLLQYLSF